jgi:hypothetical protein
MAEQVIYEGFKAALANGVPEDGAGIRSSFQTVFKSPHSEIRHKNAISPKENRG